MWGASVVDRRPFRQPKLATEARAFLPRRPGVSESQDRSNGLLFSVPAGFSLHYRTVMTLAWIFGKTDIAHGSFPWRWEYHCRLTTGRGAVDCGGMVDSLTKWKLHGDGHLAVAAVGGGCLFGRRPSGPAGSSVRSPAACSLRGKLRNSQTFGRGLCVLNSGRGPERRLRSRWLRIRRALSFGRGTEARLLTMCDADS